MVNLFICVLYSGNANGPQQEWKDLCAYSHHETVSQILNFKFLNFCWSNSNLMKSAGLSWNQAELTKKIKYAGDLISEAYDIVHLANISFRLDCDNQKLNFSDQSGKQTNSAGNKKT